MGLWKAGFEKAESRRRLGAVRVLVLVSSGRAGVEGERGRQRTEQCNCRDTADPTRGWVVDLRGPDPRRNFRDGGAWIFESPAKISLLRALRMAEAVGRAYT